MLATPVLGSASDLVSVIGRDGRCVGRGIVAAHLARDRCLGDLELDAFGDLEVDVVVDHLGDDAVDAGARQDDVALGERIEHGPLRFDAPLLRHDEHRVHEQPIRRER